MSRPLSLLLPLLLALPGRAQEPEPTAGLPGLRQACLDAATDGVVLNVAAHPDDESSRSNVILRRKHGLRVVTVYATYGDGGQNAIGREIGPELADLRVRETLRAAAISDVEVRWLGMADFGFSKTLAETLEVWGADRLRAAMAAVVDAVDPDFVITNHSLEQGHGHHRASFWAIQQVLEQRQADGRRVIPLYRRCPPRVAHVILDPTELDPFRGETYARQAHRSWTQHVTQGPWGAHNPLQVGKDHWRLVHPDGVDAELAGAPLRWVDSVLEQATFQAACQQRGAARDEIAADLGALVADRPVADLAAIARRVLPTLQRVREGLVEAHTPAADAALRRLDRRLDALQRVLLAAAGVQVEAWLERQEVPVGGQGRALVMVHGGEQVADLQVRCGGVVAEPVQAPVRRTPFDGMPAVPAGAGAGEAGGEEAAAPQASPPPTPAPDPTPGNRFAVSFAHPGNGDVIAAPAPEPSWVSLDVAFTLGGVPIALRPRLWFTPVPAVALEWDRQVVMVPRGQVVERILSATVIKWRDADLAEPVKLAMGPGVRAESIPGRLELTREHPEARLLVRTSFVADEIPAGAGLRIEVGGERAVVGIVPVEVFVPPGLRVGLVRGPDDTLERALSDLGVAYTALGRDDLAVARLEEFGTLLLDIRAYHHRPELAEVRDRILQYCRTGGRVLAMYHKPGEWNERPGHPLLAPFPLHVGNERVTEEDSPVTMLQPEHRIWTHPHRIVAEDFAGWVQERGLNFPDRWDAAWTPLLELKDSGDEQPHQGALLYTRYGRGDFIYCSLVLYRQLRVGHAGAARMLVNLLSR